MSNIKPLFAWVGGKSRLVNNIMNLLPKKFNSYYEPFIGSGVIFFNIKNKFSDKHVRKFIINDINKHLINLYKIVQSKEGYKLFRTKCKLLETKYNNLNTHEEKKKMFLEYRDKFNTSKSSKSLSEPNDLRKPVGFTTPLYFYFLLKTMFNSIYTENKYGKCITSFGDKKRINMVERIDHIHKLLENNVEINNTYFHEITKQAQKGDFVYMDPPYLKFKSDWVAGYTRNKFTNDDHVNVINTFIELHKKGVYVMLSNAYNNELIKIMKKHNFNINLIKVNCLVSGNNSGRYTNKFNEVIITNY